MRRATISPRPLARPVSVLIGCVSLFASSCSANDAQLADDYIPRLETMLMDNIASFWLDKTVDQTYGGYLIDFNAQGVPGPGATKMIVTQARTVWLFSQMVRSGFGGEAYLAAAEHGYRFLRDKMWDEEHGGFYWQVDRTGDQKSQPLKHLYGQAFGLYALSEYCLSGHDPHALALATELFDLLERKAHDRRHGGYVEFFQRDWSIPPDTATGTLGVPASMKLMNTHLHLLEALTTYHFVDKHLADWEHGEWYSRVAADGSGPSGAQGQDWKCGYHNGRAMIECIGVLRALKAKHTARSRRRSGG